MYERFDDAKELRSETLASIFADKIGREWLSVIQEEPDGYVKLRLYSRLLAGNPDREATYKEIAEVMDAATEEFPIAEKNNYLESLKIIAGIRHELLEKYGLLIISD